MQFYSWLMGSCVLSEWKMESGRNVESKKWKVEKYVDNRALDTISLFSVAVLRQARFNLIFSVHFQ